MACRLFLLTCLSLGVAQAAGAPADGYGKLRPHTAKLIAEALQDEKPTRRAAERARVLAVLLAEAAQQDLAGPDAAERAAVRTVALQINRHLVAGEFLQARTLAGRLTEARPAAAFSKDRVKLLRDHIAMDELMSAFRRAALGGLDIEAEFDRLENAGQGQALPAEALTDRLALIATQTALIGQLLQDHQPERDAGQWRRYAGTMRQTAQDLAAAVAARDGPAAYRALAAGNANCTACHKLFR